MKSEDIKTEMMKDRVVFLEGNFEEENCSVLCRELLYLIQKDNKTDITIYIDSYGGGVYEFLKIYNINLLKSRKIGIKIENYKILYNIQALQIHFHSIYLY